MHFDGWHDRYDEWVALERIAPAHAHTTPGAKTHGSQGGVRLPLQEGIKVRVKDERRQWQDGDSRSQPQSRRLHAQL